MKQNFEIGYDNFAKPDETVNHPMRDDTFSALDELINQDHAAAIQESLQKKVELRLETDEEADARVNQNLGREVTSQSTARTTAEKNQEPAMESPFLASSMRKNDSAPIKLETKAPIRDEERDYFQEELEKAAQEKKQRGELPFQKDDHEGSDYFKIELEKAAQEKIKQEELLKKIQDHEWMQLNPHQKEAKLKEIQGRDWFQREKNKNDKESIPNTNIDLNTLGKSDFEALKKTYIEIGQTTSKKELKDTLNTKGYELFQEYLHEPQMDEYVSGIRSVTDSSVRDMVLANLYTEASELVRDKENALAKKDGVLATELGTGIGVTGAFLGQIAGDTVIMSGGVGLGVIVALTGGAFYAYKKWQNAKSHEFRSEKIALREKLKGIFNRA